MSRVFDPILSCIASVLCAACIVFALVAFVIPPAEVAATAPGDCKNTSGCTTGCCTYGTQGGRYGCWCDYCCIAR